MLQTKVDKVRVFIQGSFCQGSVLLCLTCRHLKRFSTESSNIYYQFKKKKMAQDS